MASWRQPALPVSGRGLSRRFGESVWAPTMRKGAWAGRPAGTRQATNAPPRVTYPPPATSSHVSASANATNPASSSVAAALATAW
jgi:hypothetical protein